MAGHLSFVFEGGLRIMKGDKKAIFAAASAAAKASDFLASLQPEEDEEPQAMAAE